MKRSLILTGLMALGVTGFAYGMRQGNGASSNAAAEVRMAKIRAENEARRVAALARLGAQAGASSSAAVRNSHLETLECSFCLSDVDRSVNAGPQQRVATKCRCTNKPSYHRQCLQEWYKAKCGVQKCPVCKSLITGEYSLQELQVFDRACAQAAAQEAAAIEHNRKEQERLRKEIAAAEAARAAQAQAAANQAVRVAESARVARLQEELAQRVAEQEKRDIALAIKRSLATENEEHQKRDWIKYVESGAGVKTQEDFRVWRMKKNIQLAMAMTSAGPLFGQARNAESPADREERVLNNIARRYRAKLEARKNGAAGARPRRAIQPEERSNLRTEDFVSRSGSSVQAPQAHHAQRSSYDSQGLCRLS